MYWLERVPKTSFYLNPCLILYSTCLIGFLKMPDSLFSWTPLQTWFCFSDTVLLIYHLWNVNLSGLFPPILIFHFSHQIRLFWIYFFLIVRFLWMSLSPRCRHIFLVSSCFDHGVIIWSSLCWLYHHPVTHHCVQIETSCTKQSKWKLLDAADVRRLSVVTTGYQALKNE